ncbi:MAG TPA: hypothetical protein ENN25_07565 [Euryarchaeota archaeon]|nr:hypothetical protein [Euryarchaeota archaeon]
MTEEDVAAIEYAVIRALRNFDTVIGSETHAMIRLALRQGRMLSRTGKSKGRTEYLSRIADSLIESRKKVIGSWEEVNAAVEQLQKTYKSFPVGHLESVTSARMKYESFIGRVSGLSDVLEGILQESEDSEESQRMIEKLSKSREDEVESRKASDVRPEDQIGSADDVRA